MNHETMTVHRAMVELKTIDKRIAKEIDGASFCTSAKVNIKKLFGPASRGVLSSGAE